jgi:hypothetical protein
MPVPKTLDRVVFDWKPGALHARSSIEQLQENVPVKGASNKPFD